MSHNDPQRPTDAIPEEVTSEDAFDEALRQYARHPPRTSPEIAARKVLRRLEEEEVSRPSVLRPWSVLPGAMRPVFAMAAALLVAIVLWQVAPSSEQDPLAPDSITAEIPTNPQNPAIQAALDEDVVVIWLDEKTPLYMSLQESPEG